jgi:hypothetical protein
VFVRESLFFVAEHSVDLIYNSETEVILFSISGWGGHE